ncbi:MAG: glucosyltransferase-I precursor [Gemmatimonadetes bacterium]|nr:glucosyltransferase-I precursor [Gemmatimonadota bacterium]
MLKRVGSLVIAAVTLAACSESTVPTGPAQSPITAQQSILAQLSCRVDVAAKSVSCAPVSPSLVAGRSADLILGGQNQYVKLTSTNVVTTGTTSLTADLTVQNLTGQPWATTDGTTPTASGVRVFFHNGPTNGVTVANASGDSTFTGLNQPYFQYDGALLGDGILSSNETSSPINWQFNLNGQSSFSFQLLITTAMPDEQGVLRWSRSTLTQALSFEGINTVWGSSASDVWTGGVGGATTLHHWDGSSWTAMAGAETQDITSIWGSSSTNVYAVGSSKIQQWNGASWTDVSSGTSSGLLAVWGSSAADVYAGGLAGTLVHSTGGAFTPVASTGLGSEVVAAIWGTSSTNVYVGATTLHQWDGTVWSTVSTGITNIRGIWGSSPTDVWVVGTTGQISHLVGTTWTASTLGTTNFTGIWGTSASDVWAVNRGGQLWHNNGIAWVLNTASGSNVFYGVWGSGRQDVWAVGTDGGFTNNVVVHGIR